jgi:TonB-linked SusC/RagA family outer membrane protein
LKGIKEKISIDIQDQDITEALNKVFLNTGLAYKMLDNNLIVVLSTVSATQDIKIIGKITGQNGEPLSGVSITVKGTNRGSTTDNSGNFTLTAPQDGILLISYVGYAGQSVPVNNQSVLTIMLAPSVRQMDQVVVIGYGIQRKVDVTGSVGSVKGAELVKQPVMTATQAIQGKVAGVQIISSGQPGTSPQVRVRGTGSILSGVNPLYVVDGIITDDILNINTADILSVDVLKDASSTAIYGARAANGVILITTRQGSGKMKVNYSDNLGIRQAANLVKMANSQEYVAYEKGILGIPASFITPTGYSTNWYDQILRKGFYQNHNLSISGSAEKNRYLLSLGYMTDEGIVNTNNFNRITARFNNEYTPTDNLKIGVVASYSNGIGQNVNVGQIFEDAYRASPLVPGMLKGLYGNTSQFQNVGNPILDANAVNDKSIENKLQGTGYIEYKPLSWLTLKSSFGEEVDFYDDRQYIYMLPNDTTVFLTNGGSQGATQSNLTLTSTKYYHWTWDNTISFNRTLNLHRISLLAGATAEKYYKNGFVASRPDVPPDPNLWYLDAGGGNQGLQFNNSDNIPNEYTRNSYLGRVFYSYADKYLITGTFRADGSSVFNARNRWGYFPGISAGWLISKEDFMQKQRVFETLKLRGSWGKVGNSNIPSDASAITLLTGVPYFFSGNSVSGSFVPQIKDQNIKWEITTEKDLGLEYGALRGRLTGEIDLYDKITNNALIYVQVPATFGSQANPNSTITPGYVITNAASIENKGVEFSSRWSDKINSKLSYYIGGNISFNKNNVRSLNGGTPYYDGNINGYFVTETTVGHPIGSFLLPKQIGVFQSQNEVNSYTDKNGKLLQPDAQAGDFKYQYNGDGTLDTAYLGSYQPVAYYGIALGLSYANLDLSVDVYGNFGNKVYNGKRQARVVPSDNLEEAQAVNRWTTQDHSQSEPAPNGGNLPASSYFVASGNFIRINNITLGYTFPGRILQRQHVISSFRIFANAQNPLTIKKYSGFTAELPGTTATNAGIELSTYPATRTFAAGLNIGL